MVKLFNDRNIQWALTGSMNLALQGLDVNPLDIDIITDVIGFNAIVDLMQNNIDGSAGYVKSGRISSYYAKFCIDDTDVDVFSNITNMIDGKYLDAHAGWQEYIKYIFASDCEVPVMSLLFEKKVYGMIGNYVISSKIDSEIHKQTSL
ncbi:MAG: hypothetical protein HGA49_10855 [Eubacteriaceae bacterium]|nr:hypothetical protein [Eubacteriaceae bacterium]